MSQQLKHLAIIMDGNARWASQHNQTKASGHKKGAEAAKNIIKKAANLGIPYLTLYAFSSENWYRPLEEVSILLDLLRYYVKNEIGELHNNGIKLKVVGKLDKLDNKLSQDILSAMELTKNNTKMTLCIAFGYGSRIEILDACQKIIDSGTKEVSEKIFKESLYDPEMPDVDLLIRPSGVYRISNFLLWQSAYAEFMFIEKFWPDFDDEDLENAVDEFAKRQRNFGRRS
jgi:undecaprenyl diphosphate synthase